MTINSHEQNFGDYYNTQDIEEYEGKDLRTKWTKLKLVTKIIAPGMG